MNSKGNRNSSSNEEKKKKERSREKDNESSTNNKIIQHKDDSKFSTEERIKKIRQKMNYLTVKESLDKYDDDNLSFLKKNNNIEEYKLLFDTVNENIKITSEEDQKTFSKSVLSSINLLSGSGKYFELPKLKYGKSLSDEEFISLLKECISFANYNLPNAQIEKMKKK